MIRKSLSAAGVLALPAAPVVLAEAARKSDPSRGAPPAGGASPFGTPDSERENLAATK